MSQYDSNFVSKHPNWSVSFSLTVDKASMHWVQAGGWGLGLVVVVGAAEVVIDGVTGVVVEMFIVDSLLASHFRETFSSHRKEQK